MNLNDEAVEGKPPNQFCTPACTLPTAQLPQFVNWVMQKRP